MKQHEREYFISRLRTGCVYLGMDEFILKVRPPTLEEQFFLNKYYNDCYEKAYSEECMTEDHMLDWLISKGLWTDKDEEEEKKLIENLDHLRVQIYQNRFQANKREKIRLYLKATEKGLTKLAGKKGANYENTCEGIANLQKSYRFLEMCTMLNGETYDFSKYSIQDVWFLYNHERLKESQTRELARNDPWKGLWAIKDECGLKLFDNQDLELMQDQKNLVMWSKMYDNVQQSHDCPTDDVIEDDDLLDGWFVVQRRERDKQKAQSEVDDMTTNPKIASSQEIFVFAQSKEDKENIEKANSFHSTMIKKERQAVIQNKGKAVDMDFRDQRLKVQQQSNEQYKAKFRR